jgi:hypothetical protein
MDELNERRTEKRLRYYWPIWFAESFDETLTQGQMVDISSAGAAFTCRSDDGLHFPGQHITTRFSVPHYGPNDSFDMASFTRSANICRVDHVNDYLRRIAIQFAEPLPFRPGEQNTADSEARRVPEPLAM